MLTRRQNRKTKAQDQLPAGGSTGVRYPVENAIFFGRRIGTRSATTEVFKPGKGLVLQGTNDSTAAHPLDGEPNQPGLRLFHRRSSYG